VDFPIIVIGLGLGTLITLLIVFKISLSRMHRRMKILIGERIKEGEIIVATPSACFFGVKSLGSKQIRGNGALILTREELYFIRALPEKEFRIPLDSIKSVTMPRSFNGKSVFSPLLCVSYENNGKLDSIAWSVKNPDSWKKSIDYLCVKVTSQACKEKKS